MTAEVGTRSTVVLCLAQGASIHSRHRWALNMHHTQAAPGPREQVCRYFYAHHSLKKIVSQVEAFTILQNFALRLFFFFAEFGGGVGATDTISCRALSTGIVGVEAGLKKSVPYSALPFAGMRRCWACCHTDWHRAWRCARSPRHKEMLLQNNSTKYWNEWLAPVIPGIVSSVVPPFFKPCVSSSGTVVLGDYSLYGSAFFSMSVMLCSHRIFMMHNVCSHTPSQIELV